MQSVRISVLVLLAGLVAGGAWAQPNPGATSPPKSTPPKNETPKADAPKNTAKPASGSLEEMLATALRNNPDIRVAEAKLREAEASLNKARIQVMQQVVSLKNALDAQKKAVEAAEHSHKRIIELKKSNVVPEAEVQQSEALLAKAKAELAKLEADLAIPLGRLPGKYDGVDIGTNTTIIQGLSVNDSTWMDWNNVLNLNQQNGPWLVPGQLAPQTQWNLNPSLNSTLRLQPSITNWPDGTSNTLLGTLRVNQWYPYAPPATAKSDAGSITEKIRTALDRPLKIE